ncbi:acyl-CoA thioesterase domain-containing protein, partial [Vineibacter terrae]|uniref:acyl-CoA thioesterase domain-containing protein n=1 Tax=Vineibacter terrae TaxID=2586908 RepID=UPI002E2FCE61
EEASLGVFERDPQSGTYMPSPLAGGPFAGLQGGAVAGLLTAEIEAQAGQQGWGSAVSAAAWFFRPAPGARLRTRLAIVRAGGRVAVVDNTLWPDGEADPCATVRVTLARERAIDVPAFDNAGPVAVDPARWPLRRTAAPHGGPWFMDAMEVRQGDGVAWFRLIAEVVDGAGPLARVLGPADWTHGIARPLSNVLADPNPNLTVHLFRPPRGDWIGVRPQARWVPSRGLGMGSGTLMDVEGEIGCVSMAVALMPLPRPAPVEA